MFHCLNCEVIVEVIVSINLGLQLDRWSSVYGCPCHCLQSVNTLMNVSDANLSYRKLLRRHVL